MKRIICFLVILAVIVTSCAAVYAASATSKISADLERKISESQENEKIEIVVWLNTKQYSNDEIDKMVRAELGMQWFFENWGANPSLEAVHEYSEVYNRIVSELEKAANEEFIQKSGIPEEDVIFVSTKAPMVQLKADAQTIYRLAEMAEVQSMTYEGYTQSQNPTVPPTSLNFDKPTEAPTEAEAEVTYLYQNKFDKYLIEHCGTAYTGYHYKELYYHYDKNGEIDWVLFEGKVQGLGPLFGHKFVGNRLITQRNGLRPFFGTMGIYSVEFDGVYDAALINPDYFDDFVEVYEKIGYGVLMGDLDRDDEITVIDVTILQRCLADISDFPRTDQIDVLDEYYLDGVNYYSDFNRDGERDILDVTAIQRYLVA